MSYDERLLGAEITDGDVELWRRTDDVKEPVDFVPDARQPVDDAGQLWCSHTTCAAASRGTTTSSSSSGSTRRGRTELSEQQAASEVTSEKAVDRLAMMHVLDDVELAGGQLQVFSEVVLVISCWCWWRWWAGLLLWKDAMTSSGQFWRGRYHVWAAAHTTHRHPDN